MRSKRILASGAVIAALTLAVSACGSGGSGGSGGSSDSAAPVTVRGGQPENSLIPGNTGESNGHDIVELFTSTLFRYDAETAEPKPDLAESVQTNDNQNFTVRIKKGVKFHDGTEVKAKNFVDAWNYTAYGKNAQYTSYFYEPIEGFADTQCPSADEEGACVGKPKTDKLSGLTVVDDHTFTIKTTEPVSNLPVRLGYVAFAPLPDSFFKDPKAFEAKPLGAGPYKVVKYEPGKGVELEHFADYGGDAAKGHVDKINFRFYDDEEAAYNDLLAGNLDVLDTLPTSALVGEKYKQDLGERSDQEAYPAIQTVSFPPDKVNPAYTNPDLRHAISMAIDRDKIIKDQFEGAREKADSWGAPGIEGFTAGTCGDFCKFDPEQAKALFKKAGGFKAGKLAIAYNADSDHKGWITATCNSIRSVLGVDCVATPVPDFATFRTKIGEGKMDSMFRAGWIQDYPHIENFLTPQYGTGASSNDSDYSNPKFDAKIVEAGKATGDESLALYKEAEEMLVADMPSIPMWYYTATIGWSDKVTDVRVSQSSGRPDLFSMKQK